MAQVIAFAKQFPRRRRQVAVTDVCYLERRAAAAGQPSRQSCGQGEQPIAITNAEANAVTVCVAIVRTLF